MTVSGKYIVKGGKAANEVGQMFAADYGSGDSAHIEER